jgi:hypothetical protein
VGIPSYCSDAAIRDRRSATTDVVGMPRDADGIAASNDLVLTPATNVEQLLRVEIITTAQ